MKNIPKISDAEWQVMKIIWEKENIASSEIVEILKPITKWSSTTIYTLLTRLVNKKAVAIKEGSSPHLYYPLISQKEIRTEEGKFFLKKIFDGSLNLMLANFLENEKLSEEEIEELKHVLEKSKN